MSPSTPGPPKLVEAFVDDLLAATATFTDQFVTVERPSPTTAMEAGTAGGTRSTSGELRGGGTYQLHGLGCLVTTAEGVELDWDWDQHGRITFDGWRVRKYARSRGFEISGDEAAAACRELVEAGRLQETKPGWYSPR